MGGMAVQSDALDNPWFGSQFDGTSINMAPWDRTIC